MDKAALLNRLKTDVINFDHEDIKLAARKAREAGIDPHEAVNKGLLKGLMEIDRRYQRDEFFLPDLVMAAEAMNEATQILFQNPGNESGVDESVVLATVKGDIHDIGKNILANLLNGAGIAVKDLGVDVSPLEIAEVVEKKSVRVLGLSTMLSTTRGEVKRAISELQRLGLRKGLRIIVGGASMGRVHARLAGADAYAGDAVEGMKIIKNWLNGS